MISVESPMSPSNSPAEPAKKMQPLDIEYGDNSELDAIESSEDISLLSVLCRHPRVRWFAYFCGVDTPELTRQMTWYQVVAFLWAWLMRINFSFSVVQSILSCQGKNWRQGRAIYKTFLAFFAIKVLTLIPILYDICARKRKYSRFPRIDNIFSAARRPLKEAVLIVILLTILTVIYTTDVILFSKNKKFAWLAGSVYYSPVILEVFVYFSMSYELTYIESVLNRELIAPAQKAQLSTSKFNALRAFLDEKMASHMLSFSCFTLLALISCINFIGFIYYSKSIGYPLFVEIVYTLLFEGKDVIIMVLILLKIANLNEKSRDLTLRIAGNKPTEDNTYIYMQQNSNPIVYKVFGLISLYQSEMILSFLGYTVSFIVSAVKSRM